MQTLHLAHYVIPVAVPLLLISAVAGRNLDKIRENPERARTVLCIAAVVASVIVGVGTLLVRT